MSPAAVRRSGTEARAAERYEMELLARLGLDRRAGPEEIESAHDTVTAFLATAPRALRDWAHVQAAAADEALAFLSDPAALASSAALTGPAQRHAVVPGGPATPPARREDPPGGRSESTPPSIAPHSISDEEFDTLYAAVTPSAHRDQLGTVKQARRNLAPDPTDTSSGPRWRNRLRPFRRLGIAVGLIVGSVVIALVGYGAGAGAPARSPIASDQAKQAALEAQVGPLMTRIQADPNDAEALMGLGDAFFQAGQYAVAVDWLEKLVAIQPKDERALLALGAASFNLGNLDRAEEVWTAVVALDAASVEAHYDLGFLYLNRQPPDMAGVKREWSEVVRLSPGSDVAKTVTAHLQALQSPAPSGSATAPTPTPAPSAATTPGLSPSAQP